MIEKVLAENLIFCETSVKSNQKISIPTRPWDQGICFIILKRSLDKSSQCLTFNVTPCDYEYIIILNYHRSNAQAGTFLNG